jgi:putative membrane protein
MEGALIVLAHDGRFGHMDGWGGGWVWLWGSLMMLTWVAIIAGVAWLLLRSGRVTPTSPDRARQILDERLARGEITPEEHEQRRRMIASRGGPTPGDA